jgi:predicted nucleotidyltransferase
LNSPVLKWPDGERVRRSAEEWALAEAENRPDLLRVGYFGSYAGGTWGVGSDLDLVAVVRESTVPFERRALSWDLSRLPVPADLLVYTEDEWNRMLARGGRFVEMLAHDTVWLFVAECRG